MMRFEEFFVREGKLVADGVALEEIARRCPTPFYIYSASAIRTKYRLLKEHFSAFDVCYSLKANPNPAVVHVLAEQAAGAEVSSARELATALAAGCRPDHVVYVAPAKSREDVRLALESGIYALVADSAQELEMIEREAADMEASQGAKCKVQSAKRKVQNGRGQEPRAKTQESGPGTTERREDLKAGVRVLLRINTLEPQPEAKEVMVGGPSKFGFDEELVVADVSGLNLKHASIAGLQVYSASQILDARFIAGHIEYVLKLAQRLSREIGFKPECVDFGGGFGIPYHETDRELDLGAIAAATARPVAEFRVTYPECRMVFESGRYLVAEAGVFVTRVVRVKESRGRLFAICDAGMNAFSRPVFMRIRHPVRLLGKLGQKPTHEVDVCGPICTPLDCIAKGVRLPLPAPGDLVGVLNAGAYGYSMSLLDFMSLGRPAELLADGGELRPFSS
jgi:diaminopimelate decarboxylase